MKGTKVKSSKGITLVALVITIIILLILAIVAINAVNGDGIIGKAKEARQNYTEAADEEQDEITRQVGLIEEAINPQKETPIGQVISETPNGLAARYNGLVYVLNKENNTAEVTGDRGDIDYSNPMYCYSTSTAKNSIEIETKIKVDDIEYNVTAIAQCGFLGATNLSSVIIPNGVTSIFESFMNCNSLTTLNIPASVTNLRIIGNTNLERINVDENNLNYSSLDGVLFNKDKTTLITYPTGKTASTYSVPSGTQSIKREAFSNPTFLTTINIPSSITEFEKMVMPPPIGTQYIFTGNTKLTTINIDKPTDSITEAPWGATNATVNWND